MILVSGLAHLGGDIGRLPRAFTTLGHVKHKLSVTTGWRNSILVGYIPRAQSIHAPPGQDDIRTFH